MKDVLNMCFVMFICLLALSIWPFMWVYKLCFKKYPDFYQFPRITG